MSVSMLSMSIANALVVTTSAFALLLGAVEARANDAGPAPPAASTATVPGNGPAATLLDEQTKHAQRMARIASLDALVRSQNRQDLAPRVARMAKKEVARHTRAVLRLRAAESAAKK